MNVGRLVGIFYFAAFFVAPSFVEAQVTSLASQYDERQGFSPGTVYDIIKDQKGFMWFGCSDGLWRYDGYQFIRYQHEPNNKNSLSDSFVTALAEDHAGNIWVGTLTGGLNKFVPATNTFTQFKNNPKDSTSIPGNYVASIVVDNNHQIWIASSILSMLNPDESTFTNYNNKEIDQWNVSEVSLADDGNLWVGSNGDGFSSFNIKDKTFKNYRVTHPDEIINTRSNVIRAINDDHRGNVWLGSYGGLVKFEKKSEKTTLYVHDDNDGTSLSHNSIWDVMSTADGKVWIATWGGGLSQLDISTNKFENEAFASGGIYGIAGKEYPCLFLDNSEALWVGSNGKGASKIRIAKGLIELPNTQFIASRHCRFLMKGKYYTYFMMESDGLYLYSEKDGTGIHLPPKKSNAPISLSGDRVSSVAESNDGSIYVGTDFGISHFTPSTKKITHLVNIPDDTTSLRHNSVIAMLMDSANRLWVGTPFGLNLLKADGRTFSSWRRPRLSANNVVSLGAARQGIWIGTSTAGLNYLDGKGKIAIYKYDEKNDSTISSNYVTSIYTDKTGKVWISTRQGLNLFDQRNNIFHHYGSESGIVGGDVSSVTETDDHKITIRTEFGIFQYAPEAGKQITFNQIHFPFLNADIDRLWSLKDRSFYLFSANKVYRFPIENVKPDTLLSAVVLTDFKLDPNNKHPLYSAEATLSPAHRKSITLDYDQNLFSVEFASLDFDNPNKNQYAYKLEGFDDDWTYSGTRRFVTYTNLNPGVYTFRAKGSNSRGLWNEEGVSLAIRILPPPWKTWWAYTGYVMVIIGLLYLGRRAIVHSERLKSQVTLEQKEKQSLKELDDLRTKFFSNITHEFRTPLTLIQGPADELLERKNDPEAQQLLMMIKNNSQRLLRLINQLLDLARLEAREMKLNSTPLRIDLLLKTTVSQFTSLASDRKIKLEYSLIEQPTTLMADEEKIETILINLISNAIKFTPAEGKVWINARYQSNQLQIEVNDNGRGIPPEKLNHIFDRFYQVEATDSSHAEGTGIGLALVKEYVELMKGTIQAQSEIAEGTSIKISFPLHETTALAAAESKAPSDEGTEFTKGQPIENDTLPLVLIVEDNADIRVLIKTSLGKDYRYSEAGNGREGIEKARNEIPDLIISDLMMPEMDGIEFCALAKKDSRTDHIPFILLTAKAGEENKIEGLETGADDYLTKPFNKAELLLKVHNLTQLRERLQTNIKTHLLSRGSKIQATNSSEQFIVKVKEYIESHLADENLSVESLSSEVALSREQCYRKIVALTGLTPSAFIRKLRLEKAAQLLAAKWGPVSQVAYEVGFGNLSYFSKAFKEEFGKLPSEY